MARKTALYEALAVHLNPNDPAAGAEEIDAAILATQHARYRPRNCARALFWLANIVMWLGTLFLSARLSCWMAPDLWTTPMGTLARIMPIWAAALLFLSSFGFHALYWRLDLNADERLPPPPQPIHEWLAAQGKSDLRYWAEIYWPHQKILAHRREVLGFVLWRKTLLPVDRYPRVPQPRQRGAAPPDPHWDYLRSEEGRADSEAYLVSFEHRIDAWRCLCFKGVLAILAVIGFLIWLPDYPQTLVGNLLRVAAMLSYVNRRWILTPDRRPTVTPLDSW